MRGAYDSPLCITGLNRFASADVAAHGDGLRFQSADAALARCRDFRMALPCIIAKAGDSA